MRVRVEVGGRKFRVGLPTRVIFSRPAVWLSMKLAGKGMLHARRYMPEDVDISVGNMMESLPEEAVYALCDELRRIKRRHGSWQLVEVETSDGTKVNIVL